MRLYSLSIILHYLQTSSSKRFPFTKFFDSFVLQKLCLTPDDFLSISRKQPNSPMSYKLDSRAFQSIFQLLVSIKETCLSTNFIHRVAFSQHTNSNNLKASFKNGYGYIRYFLGATNKYPPRISFVDHLKSFPLFHTYISKTHHPQT
jgi:hypothetical protein